MFVSNHSVKLVHQGGDTWRETRKSINLITYTPYHYIAKNWVDLDVVSEKVLVALKFVV